MKQPYLSVIIPCYNESENLKHGALQEVRDYLSKQKFDWEVIISDDGSTDDSKEIIKKQIKEWSKFRLLENPHGSKPSALWYGIQKSNGEYTLFTDMDQSTPINQLSKLLPFIKDNDVVIGSRGRGRSKFLWYRQLGSIVFMAFRKSMILPEINDTQCGFKLFETKLVKKAFPKLEFFTIKSRATGWKVTSYDVELLHILKKIGAKIAEVRVKWEERDKSVTKGGGLSKYARESKEMLFQIMRVKLNDMQGKYNV